MDDISFIIHTLVRLSLLLALGWVTLRLIRNRNPRWSVLTCRCLISAALLMPLACLYLPVTSLAVLPPTVSETEDSETENLAETSTANKTPVLMKSVNSDPGDPLPPAQLPARISPLESEQSSAQRKAEPLIAELPQVAAPRPDRSAEKVTPVKQAIHRVSTSIPQAALPVQSEFRWWLVCWIAGSSLLLLRIGWQIQRARKLLRRSEIAPAALQTECDILTEQFQLKRVPPVCISRDIEGPCTVGLIQPAILLPAAWVQHLSETERRAILIHELSHVAGSDLLWDFFSRLVIAYYWFHPLVWRLPARHQLVCEHLSDALAATATESLSHYRRMLAQWSLRRQGAKSRLAALAMADRSQMLRRLKWLEKPSAVDHLTVSWRYSFAVITLLTVTGVATVHFSPQVLAQKTEQPEEVKNAEPKDNKEKPKADPKKFAAPLIRKPGKPDINLKQTTPKIVRVVNEKDEPIEGASVRVGWWEDNEGDMLGKIVINPPITDQKGEVTIQVPDGAARAQISAEAAGYAKAGKQYSLSGSPKLVLQPGRIIRVKALDVKGNRLPEAYPLLEETRVIGREFKQDEHRLGYFTSPVVKLDRRLMRVVARNEEGLVLFSRLIDITSPESVEEDGTIVAILEPGIRLEGRLDNSVPRPINNGCVELYINEVAEHKIGGGWTWQQTAAVKEDGTFEFDSLPTGGHVQLFALVDGYQSTRPTVPSLKNYLQLHNAGPESILDNAIERHDAFWPHLFPLTPGLYKTEVELPCTPTTSLDVKVVDPIGQPIEGAQVKFNPNGLFLGGELFIPATESLTIENQIVPRNKDEIKQRYQWAQNTFLRVRTDAQGIARVRNLPADDRESYKVSAEGYEMPVYPTSSLDYPSRYALIDLAGGQTLRRTITMEKFVPSASRKILVVDRQAEPVPEIKITVSEIAFENAPDDWQLWASQRFGPLATGKTEEDGSVQLQVPLEVNGQAVSRLRITIQGRIEQKGQDAYVQHKRLIIPREADERVVVLTVSREEPKEKYAFFDVAVDYLQPSKLLSDSTEKLLTQLQAKPSLVVLNRLLELADFDAVTPLAFHLKSNLLDFNTRKKSERLPVVTIPTKKGKRVVVLCRVRPQNATWEMKPPGRYPPEAAFVFDASDGSLIRMLGGWASSKGDYCNLILSNQGGTDDYFVSTFAFEEHGPFNNQMQWFYLGEEQQPALTTYNYSNLTGWYGKDGPSTPLAELGYIQFKLNTIKNSDRIPGTLPNGAEAPRKIYWDSAHDQFIGPIKESVDGKPLYLVVPEESFHFKPLIVQPGELVAGGGRRDYQNWHWWECVVPAGKSAELRLFSIDETGENPVETEYQKQTLSAGEHMLQLQLTDSKQDDQLSDVEIRINQQKEKLTAPRVPVANVPSVKGVPIARTGKESLDLFNRPTAQKKQRLIWRVTLK